MGELLFIYAAVSLATGSTAGDNPLPDFMPFAQYKFLWKVIGFAGLGLFQSRWIVQWLYSEKHKESKVPVAFWWLSLSGSLLCLAYFLRQQDSVGVAGYLFSAVPYTRNLMLVYAKRRRDAEAMRGFDPIMDSSKNGANGTNPPTT